MKKHSVLFTSRREKQLWAWSAVVLAGIFSTLFIGTPLATQLRDQNVQAVFFVVGMVLVAAAVLAYGVKKRPSKLELSMLIGIVAVYFMLILRLGIPERSHLIEYSVLAICIHAALIERQRHRSSKIPTAILAFTIAFLLGVLDEAIQYFLPSRVFDVEDIVFNGMAVVMAIVSSALLMWVRKRVGQARNTRNT